MLTRRELRVTSAMRLPIAELFASLVVAAAYMVSAVGCSIDISIESGGHGAMLDVASCARFESITISVDDPVVMRSITPSARGVRVIVEDKFQPLNGSSIAVPGGRMAWSAYVYHWYDGDHLGAIGRVSDVAGYELIGGTCKWYPAL